MKHQKLFSVLCSILVVVFLAACGGASTAPSESVVSADTPVPPTDTLVPPADTPVPPTDTPISPTDTPVPPTDTPIPPTATPTPIPPTATPAKKISCSLQPDEEWSIEILGESGPVTSTCSQGYVMVNDQIMMEWECTSTYEGSGNTYTMVVQYWYTKDDGYDHLKATVWGDTLDKQQCEKRGIYVKSGEKWTWEEEEIKGN